MNSYIYSLILIQDDSDKQTDRNMNSIALIAAIGTAVIIVIAVTGFYFIRELIKSTKYFFKK